MRQHPHGFVEIQDLDVQGGTATSVTGFRIGAAGTLCKTQEDGRHVTAPERGSYE